MLAPADTRVAVVVPCFDSGSALADTIASFDEPEPLELVVVDDGSTDPRTLNVLADLGRSGTKVLRQENRGPSAALMAGLHATTGRYVLRFDSDDLAVPGALSALADSLDENPSAAAAWGDIETFGLARVRVPSVPRLDPWHVTYTNGLPAAALFRRAALLEIGGWVLRDGYEDWDVWMTLAERGASGVYVPRLVYRYRRTVEGRHSASLSRFDENYRTLQARHPTLFAEQAANRRRSPAPAPLKVLVPVVDRVPFLSRLAKVQVTQALTVLLWNGGPVACWSLIRAAMRTRRRPRASSVRGAPSPPPEL